MHRTVSGAFGRLARRRSLSLVVALAALVAITSIVGACSAPAGEATFSLSIRNSGEAPVHLKVLPASGGTPTEDLLITGRSGILQTEPGPMGVTDGKPGPVTIEVYTNTCALIATVTVGEGRTLVAIDEGFAVTASAGVPDNEGAIEPDVVAPC